MRNYTLQNKQKSIHIVVFTGGLYPEPEATENFWKNSIGAAPDYVIAADSGLDACLEYKKYFDGRYDFSPRKILGDFDSISSQEILASFEKNVETFEKDKDFTDTELALRFAYKKAAEKKLKPFVTLVGGDGGRIDHLLNNVNFFRTEFSPDAWLCAFQQAAFLRKAPQATTSGPWKIGRLKGVRPRARRTVRTTPAASRSTESSHRATMGRS